MRTLTGRNACKSRLLEALAPGVDIVYHICHGKLQESTSVLYLETADQELELVDGRELVEHLYDLKGSTFNAKCDYPQLELLRGTLGSVKIPSFDPGSRLLYSTGVSPKKKLWQILTRAVFKFRIV